MPIFWMRTRDAWPDSGYGPDRFSAFDSDVQFPPPFPGYAQYRAKVDDAECIGSVFLVPHIQLEGMWNWSMTVSLPGPAPVGPINGYAATRKEAGDRVIATYRAYMAARPESYARHG